MSNTFDSALTVAALAANHVSRPAARVVPLAKIATRVRPDAPPRTGSLRVPFVTATSATAANVASYQTGDSTVAKIDLTVSEYVKRALLTNADVGQGLKIPSHIEASLIRDFEADLWAACMAQITIANFGAADVTIAAASFAIANLKTLNAAATGANPRCALLTTAANHGVASELSRVGTEWFYPGVNGGVFEGTLTGSDADVGIVAGPEALAFVCEQPPQLAGLQKGDLVTKEIVLPQLGIPAWISTWNDRATRGSWISVEAFFGCAKADAAALSFAKA